VISNEYNDELHEYKISGRIIPSVTTVLTAAGLYDDRFFTQESRDRGTYIHKAGLFYLQDDLDYDNVVPEYKGYIDALIKFMSESDCKPHLDRCEVPLFSELFCGTPDMPCLLHGVESLIDWKSGLESCVTGVQLASYEQLLGYSVKRFGLYLKPTGKYKLIPYTDRNDIKIFNAALSLYHWRASKGLLAA